MVIEHVWQNNRFETITNLLGPYLVKQFCYTTHNVNTEKSESATSYPASLFIFTKFSRSIKNFF